MHGVPPRVHPRRFSSLPERKTYEIHLPEIHGRRCDVIGSSEAWLITLDELSELQALINPVTRASSSSPFSPPSRKSPATPTAESPTTCYSTLCCMTWSTCPSTTIKWQSCTPPPPPPPPPPPAVATPRRSYASQLALTHAGDESWTELTPRTSTGDLHGYIFFHPGKLDRRLGYENYIFCGTTWILSPSFDLASSPLCSRIGDPSSFLMEKQSPSNLYMEFVSSLLYFHEPYQRVFLLFLVDWVRLG